MAVIAGFIGAVNYFVLDAFEAITTNQIAGAIESSAKAFMRYERGRGDLYVTRATAMSEVAHLRATMSIPDVDAETVRYAGKSLLGISDMPLILLLDSDGRLISDVNESGVLQQEVAALPGLRDVFETGATTYGVTRLSGRQIRVAAAPIISGSYLVGAVVIGEPIGTQNDIELLLDLSSVDIGLMLDGAIAYPEAHDLAREAVDRFVTIAHRSGSDLEALPDEVIIANDILYVTAVPLSPSDAIFFYVSRNAFSASIDNVRSMVVAASLFALLLGGLLSLRVASRISAPIGKLTHAVESFGNGRFDHDLKISSQDEVGTLAASFSTMARDIEDNREQLVASKDAAEASSRAKGIFLATMSHEIRTPLNGVIGMVDLLQRTPLSANQTRYCNTISSSSRSLLTILNDILDLSKIEAGHLEVDPVEVDLPEVIGDTVHLFTQEASSKGLGLDYEIDLPPGLIVCTDGVRVRQVLTNLINNAIKFTESGSVRIRVRTVQYDDADLTARFEVIDTGMGMDAETQLRVFESFRQADGSMSRRFGGTGLGLTICKQIVELLGGELRVESAAQQGSRFWFDLKMAISLAPSNSQELLAKPSRPSEEPHDGARAIRQFQGLTALLAEDNLVNQEVAREALRLLGVNAFIANNGRETVELFAELGPSFVLMDCQMPEMDGHEATLAIREIEANEGRQIHTPIIALTANALTGDREKCIASGMDDFIGKPFELADLHDVLLSWFDASGAEVPTSGSAPEPVENIDGEPMTFDQSVIDSLRAIGQSSGKDLAGKVIELYLDQAPQLIEQIGEALADKNLDQLAAAAHTLKSSSANVGALLLASQCEMLETGARNKRIETSVDAQVLKESFAAVATCLDAMQPNVPPPADAAVDDDHAGANCVLVVDDDDSFRLTTGEALSAAGFSVATVSSGSEAEASALNKRPDLILLDAIMPDIDGFETCQRFADNPKLANIPILMVTGLNDRASVDRAFECGASGFVTKPIQYPVLGHQVRFVIRSNETAMELLNSKQQLATAQRIASLGYWMWNTATGEFTTSDELSVLTAGAEIDSVDKLVSMVEPEERDALRADVDRVVGERSAVESTFRLHSLDGSVKYVHQCLSTKPSQGGDLVVVAAVQDVTARRTAEDQVRYLAYYDALTGLASRTRLYERIDEVIKSARRREEGFAVLFLDLDGFKDVNDNLGHSEGDTLLKVVAERLSSSLRDNDFVARFGGDEFCIILEDISDGVDINEIVARCLHNLAADVELNSHVVRPHASIGIARYPSDGEDMNSLLRAADSAMYEAKANGKHRFEYFDSSMAIQAEQRFLLAQELRRALENNEFELYYQPQISLRSGNVEGYEALVRWNHPTRGLVPPNDFIPELERLGLINDLGDWAISRACEQVSQWQSDHAIETRVCVNIAATHFQEMDLVDTVQAALEKFSVNPDNLELEVTETALQYSDETLTVLLALKTIGVSIAIDDFGSGYSSLGSLQHLPVDCLKIDRMFIRDLLVNPKDAVLLGTIMTLAHALGFRVVAEGVEGSEQVQVLDSLDCDLVQGFFFSKPLQADDVVEFAEKRFLSQTGSARLKVVF